MNIQVVREELEIYNCPQVINPVSSCFVNYAFHFLILFLTIIIIINIIITINIIIMKNIVIKHPLFVVGVMIMNIIIAVVVIVIIIIINNINIEI